MYGTPAYAAALKDYLKKSGTLAIQYAKAREMALVPVQLRNGQEIKLSAGEHSGLIKGIVEDFASRYVPNGQLIYVGDTGDKFGYFDAELLKQLCVVLDKS